ncbi:LysM peptidoglycan-binding domain-containing protein [bacterium]|nr:LysM peptidoglycan-binding domain-containing protein [bacterium]
MKFNWKGHTRMLLMGLFLSLAGACSSQQQQQEGLQLEQEMDLQQGEQGQAEELDQETAQQGQSNYDNEESEEALSQNENSAGEGEYGDQGAEEQYNTASDNELEGLMADDSEPLENEVLNNSDEYANQVANDANNTEDFSANANESLNTELSADANEVVANEAPVNATEQETYAENSAPVAQPGEGLPETGSKMSYIVQRGETLSMIAENIYGDRAMWQEMSTLTGMENPNRIYPGDVVYYQLTDATMGFATAYENVPRGEVNVQSGDTLASIARNIYGDESQWKSVWRQNDQIDNPDQLEVGQTIFYVNTQEVMAQKKLIDSLKNHASATEEAEATLSVEALEEEVQTLESLTMLDLVELASGSDA